MNLKQISLTAYVTAVASLLIILFSVGNVVPRPAYLGKFQLKHQVLETFKSSGVQPALQIVADQIRWYPQTLEYCHGVVHEIGNLAFQKYQSVPIALSFTNEACNSGYMHGVIEVSFKDTADIAANVNSVCTFAKTTFSSWECFHGIGHGAMYFTENNVPASLKICAGVSSNFGQSACKNGVFMENFNTDDENHPSDYRLKSDPLSVCSQFSETELPDCLYYAVAYAIEVGAGSFSQLAAACKTFPSKAQPSCLWGLGAKAMLTNFSHSLAALAVCTDLNSDQVANCIQGLSFAYLFHSSSYPAAQKFCRSLPENYSQVCYNSIAHYQSWF